MLRPIPDLALVFIRAAEACRLKAYPDSRGVWTIGWGHTGPEVVPGLVITLDQAVAWLMSDVMTAALRLASVVRPDRIAALDNHQYAALLSFVFNLGEKPDWAIWGVINGGRLGEVKAQMMRFDKARVNGVLVEVPGLLHRRAAECALWSTPDTTAAAAIVAAAPIAAPPSSETREADTPPTPIAAKPLRQSKSFLASAATAAVAAATPLVAQLQDAATAVNKALTPFVGSSEILQHIQGDLTLTLAALAVTTVFLVWLKHKEAQTQ